MVCITCFQLYVGFFVSDLMCRYKYFSKHMIYMGAYFEQKMSWGMKTLLAKALGTQDEQVEQL